MRSSGPASACRQPIVHAVVTSLVVFAFGISVLVACASSDGWQGRTPSGIAEDAASPSQRAGTGSPTANLGVYYFGGWSGSMSNFHFEGLPDGPYQDRQPLSGWLETKMSLRSDLYWASKMGVSFFDFLYYYRASSVQGDPHLNDMLGSYLGLHDHHGVPFAITYDNEPGFAVPNDRWHRVVENWVTRYFLDPDYMRIDGKPVFVILDAYGFFQQHGGEAGPNEAAGNASVNAALADLRTAARDHGLPGVFVVGGTYVEQATDWNYFPRPASNEDYDALDQYAYPVIAGAAAGERDFSEVVSAEERTWNRFAAAASRPYVPSIMAGWDPRPWDHEINGNLWWFDLTPLQLETFIGDAIAWVEQHPSMNVTPAPEPPLIFLTAWNELGEGQIVVPTVGATFSTGQAIASALGMSWDPQPRTVGLSIRGHGSVRVGKTTCSTDCSVSFDEGLVALLRAKPERGWTFAGWTGGCTRAHQRCSILMDADASVAATFVSVLRADPEVLRVVNPSHMLRTAATRRSMMRGSA